MKYTKNVILLFTIFLTLNFGIPQSSADVTAYDITLRFEKSYIHMNFFDDLGTPADIHFTYWSNRVSNTPSVDVGNCDYGECNHGDYVLSTRVIHGDIVSVKMYDDDLVGSNDHLLTVQIEFKGETTNGAFTTEYWTPFEEEGWIVLDSGIKMRTIHSESFGQGETETHCSHMGTGAVPCHTYVVGEVVYHHTTSQMKVKSSLHVEPPPPGGGGGGGRWLCDFNC